MTKPVLIFDLDGTLIDSRKDIGVATNHTLQALGLKPISQELIESFVGSGVGNLLSDAFAAAGKIITPDDVQHAKNIFQDFYIDHCLDFTTWYPDVLETLNVLSATHSLHILTNKPRVFTEKILTGLAADPLFGEVICADDSFGKKPDPAGLLEIIRRQGATPANALFVGDSTIDLETAEAAQVPMVLVTYGFQKEFDLKRFKPVRVIERFKKWF